MLQFTNIACLITSCQMFGMWDVDASWRSAQIAHQHAIMMSPRLCFAGAGAGGALLPTPRVTGASRVIATGLHFLQLKTLEIYGTLVICALFTVIYKQCILEANRPFY